MAPTPRPAKSTPSFLAGSIVRHLYLGAFIAVVPALCLILYLGNEFRAHLIADFKDDTRNVAEAVTALQLQFAGNTRQLLEALARVLATVDPADDRARQQILADFQAANPVYSRFLIANAAGDVTAAAVPLDGPVNVADRRYFREAKRTGRFSAGEFVLGRRTNIPTFHFAYPLQDRDGGFAGIVFAAVELTFPKEFLANLRLPPDTSVVLFDHQGLRLHRYPSVPEYPAGQRVVPQLWSNMQQPNPDGFFQEVGQDGKERLYTTAGLRLDGMDQPYCYVMLTVPLHVLVATAQAALARNLALLAATAALALCSVRFLGRRTLGRQAAALLNAARQLGEGDLSTRTNLEGLGGEFGALARTFDAMAEKLDLREQERLLMEQQLRHMALHDPLTGLPNRTLLRDRIVQAQAWSRRHPLNRFAVLFLDVNRFKAVNDSLGHAVGDGLLVQVAGRLDEEVRDGDTVARFGGDEFVVVLTGARSSREIMHVAHRLAEVLRRPYLIDGHSVASSASIGIELALADGLTPDEMIRNASLAMLHAKDMGSRHPKVFSRRLQDSLASLQVVETELLGAIEGGQLVIALQPIVDAADDCRPMGFEVLSRWHHPVRGVIPPGSFIPVAEESGLIVRLGEWVLRSACAVLADWRLESGRAEDIFLSVNVSPRQLSRSGFVPLVRDLLAEFELPPAQLQLEFTETALMESSPQVQERLRELSDLGVRLAIDDFGTGYSNMALLTRLPLTDLKIDLSIVAGAERKPESRAILRAIATMARSLGLEVIAEGVETPAQRDILIGLGCRLHQGFLHGRPMPEPEARRLLNG